MDSSREFTEISNEDICSLSSKLKSRHLLTDSSFGVSVEKGDSREVGGSFQQMSNIGIEPDTTMVIVEVLLFAHFRTVEGRPQTGCERSLVQHHECNAETIKINVHHSWR